MDLFKDLKPRPSLPSTHRASSYRAQPWRVPFPRHVVSALGVCLCVLLFVSQFSGVFFVAHPPTHQHAEQAMVQPATTAPELVSSATTHVQTQTQGSPQAAPNDTHTPEGDLQLIRRECKSLLSVFMAGDSVQTIPACLRWLQTFSPQVTCSDVGTQPLYYHTFWTGDLEAPQFLALFAFFKTQACGQLILWVGLDEKAVRRANETIEAKHKCLAERIAVRAGYPKAVQAMAKGTPFEPAITSYVARPSVFADPGKLPYYTDLLRLLLFHTYGGVWFDMDVLMLRDWSPLLRYDFAYRWSLANYINNAVMHFRKDSPILHALVKDMAGQGGGDFGFMGQRLTDRCRQNRNDCGTKVVVFPAAFFDPLWPFLDTGTVNDTFLPYLERPGGTVRFESFFEDDRKTSSDSAKMENGGFFEGAYGYHWHRSRGVGHMKVARDSWFRYFEQKFLGCPHNRY